MSTPSQRRKPNAQTVSDSPQPDSPKIKRKGVGATNILGGLASFIIVFFAASQLITGTWTWGYESKYTNIKRYIPKPEIVLSEEQLKRYDGSDPSLPIYLAINGEVYDVTEGRSYYGPGGGYQFFAGVDAARAYITGCFQTHLTHDLRGLTDDQLKSLEGWQDFYRNHQKYYKVGTVMHAPIDDDAPLPEPCNADQKPN